MLTVQSTEAQTVPEWPPVLIPQKHGGALRNGGTNRGGPGAPSSQIRAASRDAYALGLERIVQILSGEREASTADELRALDIAGKYGLGEAKTIIPEEVIEALGQVLGNPVHQIPIESIPGIVTELAGLLKG